MHLYLVERDLPGVTRAQLTAIHHAARQVCDAFALEGKAVRYVRSTFLPGESRCLSLFEAPDAEQVREVNEAAQLPYNRIITALDLEC